VNGASYLGINAGVGKAIFTGVVGGVTPLVNLNVTSSGTNLISQNITVSNDFYWDNGSGTLTLGVGKIINAGNDLTILAGTFVNKGSLVAGGTISTP
jgi:hypothetical protein